MQTRGRSPRRSSVHAPVRVPMQADEAGRTNALWLGDTSVEISDFGVAVYPPGWTLGPRLLGDYELVWIIEGDVEWTVNGVSRALPAGSIALARPGMHDFFRWDVDGWTRHAFFHFTLAANGLGDPDEWPLVRTMPAGDVVRPLFQLLLQTTASHPPGWPGAQQDAARLLLWAYISGRENVGDVGRSILHPVIERIVSFLRQRWMTKPLETPTLAALAAAANVSTQHLCRIFASEVGTSPVETVRTLRLYWAAMQLSSSATSISSLAKQAGFADAYHFSRRFRDLYGVSPRGFREQSRAGQISFFSIPTHTATVASRVWRLRE